MEMNKKSSCGLCASPSRASTCTSCVNYRINEYKTLLKSLKSRRDILYFQLSKLLAAKGRANDQLKWSSIHREKHANLIVTLRASKEKLIKGKAKIESVSFDLKENYGVLESAHSVLLRNRVEKLDKFYPNLISTHALGLMAIASELLHKQSVIIKQIRKLFPQRRVNIDGHGSQYDEICNARLPKGLDPLLVPSEEIGSSFGYMVQLLNLVVHNLTAPALHNSGFAGSCSRIWQRDSYCNPSPSSSSTEYPLFIPRQNYCSTSEISWNDRNSSNFGMASTESEGRLVHVDSIETGYLNYSPLVVRHAVEIDEDLRKGISLLKRSVACVTTWACGHNYLSTGLTSGVSTFGAFSKLLATLSSSKQVRSALTLNMAGSRWPPMQVKWLGKSSPNESSILDDTISRTSSLLVLNAINGSSLSNPASSYVITDEISEPGDIGGWDLVERPGPSTACCKSITSR